MNPKKPNSANKKVTKVPLLDIREFIVNIPGEKHILQQNSVLLIESGKKKKTYRE